MRDIVTLACTECKRRNYTTTKNKKKTPDKFNSRSIVSFAVPILFIAETK